MQKLNEMAQMVKNKLSELAIVNKTDHFANVSPYDDKKTFARLSPSEQTIFKQYNIDQKDLYAVISKFDMDPKNLTIDERNLRKKYLGILKTFITSEVGTSKGTLRNLSSSPIAGATYEEISYLLLRTIDLFIEEAENVDTPPCPECKKETCLECKKEPCPDCPECKKETCSECKKEPCPDCPECKKETCPECKKEPCPECKKEPCPKCQDCLPCVVYPTCPSFMGGKGCGLPTWLVVSVFILFVICIILIRNMYV